jgi:hypothetical protein
MYKSTFTLAVSALAVFSSPDGQEGPAIHFTQETMIIEYSPALHQAEVVVEAECEEALDHVEILSPSGAPILKLQARGGQGVSLTGLRLETGESSLSSLCAHCPEGLYQIRARALSGRVVFGSAALSQALVAAPVITHPLAGAANVSPASLSITWNSDPQAAGYTIDLEQNENDGLMATVPAGTSSFQVPAGVLAPNTPTRLEIQAIAPNGNRTLSEIRFTTL